MAVSRLRLKDVLESRLPSSVGLCPSDVGPVSAVVNAAQERLLTCREAGDTGWWGGYPEIALTVTQAAPYITLPRGSARLIKLDVCDRPVRLQNQFYEYLTFGSGRWPKNNCSTWNICGAGPEMGFRRNMVPTFVDIATPNQGLRIYPGSPADVNLTVIVGGTDANGQTIYCLRNGVQIRGTYASLLLPFVDLRLPGSSATLELSSITSIQKDVTVGPVNFYQVDLTTGAQTLLLTMEPGETVAAYSRYYLNNLPDGCCTNPAVAPGTNPVTLKAMVKLDLIPAKVPTDYLLIQSLEALIAEAQSIRLADMDSTAAKGQAADRHTAAIRYLQGQLVHYEGKENPAINFAPFGYAHLVRQRIGYQM